MAGTATTTDMLAFFLTYNILAFMTQPLTGWWVDHLYQKQAALRIATSLLATAIILLIAATLWWGLNSCSKIAVAILLGMGNSMFHVWGGKLTAILTDSDIRALGIFVSTGDLGLTIGVLYASWWLLLVMLLLIILLGIIHPRTSTPMADFSSPPPAALRCPYFLMGTNPKGRSSQESRAGEKAVRENTEGEKEAGGIAEAAGKG
jgi:hypothetical protein